MPRLCSRLHVPEHVRGSTRVAELLLDFAGHSVLTFQHFACRNRTEHVAALVAEARRRTAASRIWPLRTAHAVFLLLARQEHEQALAAAVDAVLEGWAGRISAG